MPSRAEYKFYLLTALVSVAIIWLLLLTGFREYWGFWQSPKVYGFLSKEYPEWMREYVRVYYDATFYFVGFIYSAWLYCGAKELWGAPVAFVFVRRLAVLILMTALIGAVIGVRCSNNFIGWLDSGRLHGVTPMQVHP